MPVSHKYKLIFIHIPKCAGSTIEDMVDTNSLEEYFCMTPAKYTGLVINKKKFETINSYNNCVVKVPQHFTYRELQQVLPPGYFDLYKKFTVVRHPFTRIVSGYHFITYVKHSELKKPSTNKDWEEARKSWEEIYKINNFYDYVSWLDKPGLDRIAIFAGHFETQTSYLKDKTGNIATDIDIFKYENLNECFNYLKPITNFITIPHLRKSHIKKTWQDYRTPELEEKIYNFYKEDFLNFNYKCDI